MLGTLVGFRALEGGVLHAAGEAGREDRDPSWAVCESSELWLASQDAHNCSGGERKSHSCLRNMGVATSCAPWARHL